MVSPLPTHSYPTFFVIIADVLEIASECYCASTLPTAAVLVASTSCNMLCSGNNKEYCGAGGLLDVYKYQPVLLRDKKRWQKNYLEAF